jgi:hypothetical protein
MATIGEYRWRLAEVEARILSRQAAVYQDCGWMTGKPVASCSARKVGLSATTILAWR